MDSKDIKIAAELIKRLYNDPNLKNSKVTKNDIAECYELKKLTGHIIISKFNNISGCRPLSQLLQSAIKFYTATGFQRKELADLNRIRNETVKKLEMLPTERATRNERRGLSNQLNKIDALIEKTLKLKSQRKDTAIVDRATRIYKSLATGRETASKLYTCIKHVMTPEATSKKRVTTRNVINTLDQYIKVEKKPIKKSKYIPPNITKNTDVEDDSDYNFKTPKRTVYRQPSKKQDSKTSISPLTTSNRFSALSGHHNTESCESNDKVTKEKSVKQSWTKLPERPMVNVTLYKPTNVVNFPKLKKSVKKIVDSNNIWATGNSKDVVINGPQEPEEDVDEVSELEDNFYVTENIGDGWTRTKYSINKYTVSYDTPPVKSNKRIFNSIYDDYEDIMDISDEEYYSDYYKDENIYEYDYLDNDEYIYDQE